MGPAIAPDLRRIARNTGIQWHYIAYVILGKMKDRDSIPFLFEALDSEDKEIQKHAVWGLDCLIGLGRYNDGDADAAEIKSRYRRWWEKHKHEFP
ncbi:HEAT repeat domain-containing protein [bacterium]|nr:HEAT repeat domain-containing protein [bacterium]